MMVMVMMVMLVMMVMMISITIMEHQTQLTVSGANGVHGRHVRRRHRVSGEVLDQGVVGQDDDVDDVHEDVGHNALLVKRVNG